MPIRLAYHLESADYIPKNIVDSIKAAFRSKAITIIAEGTNVACEHTDEMKSVLAQRIEQPKEDYISAATSLEQLRVKHTGNQLSSPI